MSGGGGAPKAPNVGMNIDRANTQFETETGRGAQLWNTAQGYNQTAQDTMSRIMGSTTPVMDEINQSARNNLTSYGRSFIPLQEQQAKDAATMSSPDYVARQRSLAMGDVAAANEAARRNSARALASAGVDPNSIQGQALDRQANVINAAKLAGAGTRATQQAQADGRAAVASANQLGLQVQQGGTQAGTAGGALGAQMVQGQNQTNAAAINNSLAPATYSNLAMNANTGATNIASQNYQDQMAQHAADEASKNSTLSNVASIAGAAAMFMSEGGAVPKEGALPESPIPGSTDTQPAFLTPGEFVIPDNVVRFKGEEFFHKLIDSARMKANERKTQPEQVIAHKTDNSSAGKMGGGVIPGYMAGGPVMPTTDVFANAGRGGMTNVGVGNAGVLANSGAIGGKSTWQTLAQNYARNSAASATGQPLPNQATGVAGMAQGALGQVGAMAAPGASPAPAPAPAAAIPPAQLAGGFDPRFAQVA
jgi:hypothetical protein